MIPILAKTEWPSLGELVWEYLTTDEALYYPPTIVMLAIIILYITVEWLLVAHVSPLLPDEKLLGLVIVTNFITKFIASDALIPMLLDEYFISAKQGIPILAVAVVAAETIIYSAYNKQFSFGILGFVVLSTALGAIGVQVLCAKSFYCIAMLLFGVIAYIRLIATDKLLAAEQAWKALGEMFEDD